MLTRASRLHQIEVASLHTGEVIGVGSEIIINPDDLSIVGFYLNGNREEVLLRGDIREVTKNRVIIDSLDVIAEPQDLHRHKRTLEIDYQLIGAKAATRSGKKIGTVEEYIIDDVSWLIQKIHIRQSILRSFSSDKLIVDRRQVVEVTKSRIILEDASIGQGALAAQQLS